VAYLISGMNLNEAGDLLREDIAVGHARGEQLVGFGAGFRMTTVAERLGDVGDDPRPPGS